jgi:hypothetical protein
MDGLARDDRWLQHEILDDEKYGPDHSPRGTLRAVRVPPENVAPVIWLLAGGGRNARFLPKLRNMCRRDLDISTVDWYSFLCSKPNPRMPSMS